jgi:hypothetical protein
MMMDGDGNFVLYLDLSLLLDLDLYLSIDVLSDLYLASPYVSSSSR